MKRLFICLLFMLTLAPPALADADIRSPAVAGTWYPANPKALQELVEKLLGPSAPAAKSPTGLRAVIAPHAGFAYSGATAGKVYRMLRGAHYKRVLLLGPSHYGYYRGLAVSDAKGFATPLGTVETDIETVAQLHRSPMVSVQPETDRKEHSLEAQLPFLQTALAPSWKLVPVLVGRMGRDDFARAAKLLRPLVNNSTLVVVSTDFTHYGPRFDYLPFPNNNKTAEHLKALDMGAFDTIAANDGPAFLAYLQKTGITICGRNAVAILLNLLEPPVKVDLVDYQTSGAMGHDYNNSVSYLAATFSQGTSKEKSTVSKELSNTEMSLLHKLASTAVRAAVTDDPTTLAALKSMTEKVPPRLKEKSGAFVTLKKGDRLRGCIGYIAPIAPLYQAIAANGHNAALRDPRFLPVQSDELSGLTLEISVLTPPQPISGPEQFQPGKQGIILHKEGHSAVYLPEVATEQGWNREQTLTHLSRKAGLDGNAWKSGARFEVFTSQTLTAPLK